MNSCCINSPSRFASMCKPAQFDCRTSLYVALGVLTLISSLAASGLLFPHIGYVSFSIGGGGIFFGGGLILCGLISKKTSSPVTASEMSFSSQETVEEEGPLGGVKFDRRTIERAREFNGKRHALRKKVEQGTIPLKVLEAHFQCMFNNRSILKSFLWKAEHNGNSVYLVGTCHGRLMDNTRDMNCTKDMDQLINYGKSVLPKQLILVSQHSKKLFLEIEMNKEALQAYQNVKIFNQDSLLHERLLPMINGKVFNDKRIHLSIECGIDILLTLLVLEQNNEVFGLESVETHMQAFQVLSQWGNFETSLEILDAAQWGNWESIVALLEEMPSHIREAAIESRNENMTRQMIEQLKNGEQALFAVGVNHFVGPKGILALLEQKEIKITPIQL